MTSKHPTPIHTYLACPLQGGGGLCYPGGPTQAHDLKFFDDKFFSEPGIREMYESMMKEFHISFPLLDPIIISINRRFTTHEF